jgi:iron complex outermembrane receptor protein
VVHTGTARRDPGALGHDASGRNRVAGELTPRTRLIGTIASTVILAGICKPGGAQEQLAVDDATVDPGSPVLLDSILVTGTRIRRIEVEGPLPITTIDRLELERSGAANLADSLRDVPYNSFGNVGEVPNSSASTLTVPSLRGIGGKFTLTLLDGYRLPGVAYDFAGAASSLTGIPAAAIDRVEILRDGASAIYGSEAIGGVINLRTRRDAVRPQVELQWNEPGGDGARSWGTNFVTGGRNEQARWLVALETLHRDPLVAAQRDYLLDNAPLSFQGNPGSFIRLDPQTLRPVALAQPDARCPDALDSDPLFPNSTIAAGPGSATTCQYRYRAESYERAGLDSHSLLGSLELDLGRGFSLYGRLLAIDNDSQTRLAPAPITLSIPADLPSNPTLGEVGPGLGYPLRLLYRLSALGPRTIDSNDRSLHALLGLRGRLEWADGGEWSLALIGNRLDTHEQFRVGYALTSAVLDAVASGLFDPFTALPGDASGLEAARIETQDRSGSRSTGIEGTWNFDLTWLDAGATCLAFGFEFRRDAFTIDYDPCAQAGDIAGSSAGEDERASRNYGALHVEAYQTIGDRWQFDLAVRPDRYQDAGGASSPKFAIAFRPAPEQLLRASYGRGFQAPSLSDAYGQSLPGFDVAVDSLACAESDGDPITCTGVPLDTVSVPNRFLRPERARQFGLGWLWQPARSLDLAVDYYRTRINDQIGVLQAQRALLNELDCATSGRICERLRDGEVIRDESGLIQTIVLPRINIARRETSGLDLEIGARRAIDRGELGLNLRVSRILDLKRIIREGEPATDVLGVFGTPRWRAGVGVDWQHGAHGLHLDLRYTAGFPACVEQVDIFGIEDPSCAIDVRAHTEIDAQWRWGLPWKDQLALGVRNLTDRRVPLDPQGYFAYGLYDPTGRTFYLRYRRTF